MKVILFFWQLPQNVLGLLFRVYWALFDGSVWTTTTKSNIRKERYEDSVVYVVPSKTFSGVSLGRYIFIGESRDLDPHIRAHEYGHSIQSKILGPLYLLLVGIPSLTLNRLSVIKYNRAMRKAEKRFRETGQSFTRAEIVKPILDWYYSSYPEKWADKLGGVRR